jgi:FkbM family methyltransferase
MNESSLYSQNDEQRFIVDYFAGFTGRWLDIGANDGWTNSNTLRLAELGWSGVAVEPDPHAFCRLLDNYGEHQIQSVASLHALVGLSPDIVKFYGSDGDGISTTSETHRALWQSQTRYREFFVPAVTVNEILARFGAKFDFVSIDAEGESVSLLRQMPLANMGVRLVCVEHDGRLYEALAHCGEHGLTDVLLRNAENLVIARPK